MGIINLNTHAASYVTVAELAEYWDVTRQLVYKHIRSGLLPAIRLGPRCFRIPTKEVVAFEQLASSKWRKNAPATGRARSGRAPIVPLRNRAGQNGVQTAVQSAGQNAGQVSDD